MTGPGPAREPGVPPSAGDVPAPPQPWSPVGRNEDRQWSQQDLDWWLRRDPDVVHAAIGAGRLTEVGIGPRKPHYGKHR